MTTLPPYAQLLRLSAATDENGAPIFIMPFHDDVVGRPGFLHGGAIAGLLEFAAFSALRVALGDPAVGMKPINVTVDYMRGGQPRDTFASATIERLGARIANIEAQAWQKDRSAPIAAAQMNFLLARD
jgi:acyl-coenzyme A thioesterase PaaI-like protein